MIFEVFIEYLKVSILSTILIAVVLWISKYIGAHFRKTWRLSVWIIISLSAVFPVGLVSVLLQNTGIMTNAKNITPVLGRFHYNLPVRGDYSFADIVSSSQPTYLYSLIDAIPHWIAIIWISGMMLQATLIIFRYHRFHRIVCANARPLDEQVEIPFFKWGKPHVYVNPFLPSSITVGIISPRIFMETDDVESDEFKVVLSHECMHYKRRDLWKKLLFQIVLIIHWYNPVMRKLPDIAGNDIELCCDESVLKFYGKSYTDTYAKTLGKLAIASYDNSFSTSVGFGFNQKIVMTRLKAIYENTKSIKLFGILVCTILVILTGYVSHSIHGAVSLFEIPGFKGYYDSAIYEWYDLDSIIKERNAETHYGVEITDEMLKDPRYANADGSINMYRLMSEQSKLQNVQEYPDIWHNYPGRYCSENGLVKPHVLYEDGFVALYYNENIHPWFFHKGDHIHITISFDNSFFGSTGDVLLGFIKNNQFPDSDNIVNCKNTISIMKAWDNANADFIIPESGAYCFYLLRLGNGPQCINWVKITY